MKKLALLAAAVLVAGSAFAQYEEMYIFRNDKQFNYYKAADVKELSFDRQNSKMAVTTAEGTTSMTMSSVDSCVIRATAIPDIYVNLTEYPDISDLFKGNGFTKSTIYLAKLRMDGNGMYDDLPEQDVEFRGRGNSTWNFAKTPYRFKMAKKTAVCGMPKAKTFALIANFIDPSLMRNCVSFYVAQKLGMPFTNHSIPVNVYLNGYYKGAYMMTEKIGTGSGSVDIPEETGMLFEMDSNYDEDYKFIYNWGYSRVPVMVKDPDLTEIKVDAAERSQYFQQWQADFTEMANVLTGTTSGKKLSDYVDLQDAAKFVLVNSLACNTEMRHPKSLYLHKEALGTDYKYHFGPVWDFDWSYGYQGLSTDPATNNLFASNGNYQGGDFMKALCSNSEFRAVYKEVWNTFMTEIYPTLFEYIDGYAAMIEPSAKRDGLVWPDQYAASYAKAESAFDHKTKVNTLKTWIKNRVEYCNNHTNWGLY